MPDSARKNLNEYWQSKIKTWRGQNYYLTMPVTERYAEFSASGLDYKGQLSSIYSRVGGGGGITVKANFGDLIVPTVLLASINIGVGGKVMSEVFIILQRAPDNVYVKRISDLKLSDPLPAVAWETAKPIILQAFEGYRYEGSYTVSATIGAKTPSIPLGTDELGFGLEARLTAGGTVTGQLIQLTNCVASYFPSPNATDIGANYQLSMALAKQLGRGEATEQETRKEQIQEIEAWIVTKLEQNALKPTQKSMLEKLKKGAKTKRLIADLTQLKSALQEEMARLPAAAKRDYENRGKRDPKDFDKSYAQYRDAAIAVQQINVYLGFLGNTQLSPASYLNYFSLRTFDSSLTATGELRANAGIVVTDLDKTNPYVRGVASLKGAASMKNAQYRWQSLCKGGGAISELMMTQDTTISYRQVMLDGSLDTYIGIAPPKKTYGEKNVGSKNKNFAQYNTMTYQSVITYWSSSLPNAGATTPDEIPVTTYSGSGIVFGCSADLLKLYKTRNAATGSSNKYLTNLSRQLRVDEKTLVQFLKDAFADYRAEADLETTNSGLPSTVVLESSFAFDSTVALKATLKTKERQDQTASFYDLERPFANASIRQFGSTLAPKAGEATNSPALEALRLRVRISDVNETVTPLVSLGFTFVVGVFIDFSKIKGVGHEGFFDFYVRWFNDELNQDKNLVEAQNRSVPPVALLHQ